MPRRFLLSLLLLLRLLPLAGGENGLLRPMRVEWARQLGSAGHDRAWGVAADAKQGSRDRGAPIYVVGYTDGYLGDVANDTSHASPGGSANADAVIFKLQPDGQTVWSRRFGSARADDYLRAAVVDHHGNIIAAGGTRGSLPGFANQGDIDLIVVKFDDYGDLVWQKQIGSTAQDDSWGVAVDMFANVYVVGCTRGRFKRQPSFGNWDVILLKYRYDGSLAYTTQYGSAHSDLARGLTVDLRGNAYVAGRTAGALQEDVENAGLDDAFLAKFDANGALVWVRQHGSGADDEFGAIAMEYSTAMIYTLRHNYPNTAADMASGIGTLKLFPDNVTLEKWDSEGEPHWKRQLGTALTVDRGYGVAVDENTGIVYACGTSLKRKSEEEGGQVDWTHGSSMFFVKYGPDGIMRHAERVGSEHWDEAYAIDVGLDERIYTVGSTEGSFHGLKHGGGADILALQWAPMKLGTAGFPWKTFAPTLSPTAAPRWTDVPSPPPTPAVQVVTSSSPRAHGLAFGTMLLVILFCTTA